MIQYTYKDTEGTITPEITVSFTGFQIKKEYSKVSLITEYKNGEVLGTMSFRPTQKPTIFSVKYGNYREERYSHGGVSAVYQLNTDGKMAGEYFRYNTDGTLKEVRYFDNGVEVTNDIMKFLNFAGEVQDFYKYSFREDERFNIMVKYGAYFKFISEYSHDPSTFDDKMQYCLQ